jgi:hypothetical protein
MGSRPGVVLLGIQGHAGSTARFRFEANAGLGSETLFLWGLAGLVGLPAVGAWRPVVGLGSSAIVGTGVGLNGGPRVIVVLEHATGWFVDLSAPLAVRQPGPIVMVGKRFR